MCLADEHAFLVNCKFAIVLPYLGRCSPAECILMLSLNYLGSNWWGVLDFVIRQINVRYVLCTIYVACAGMYRVVRIFVVVDRI